MPSKDELRAEVLRLRTEIDELRRMREDEAQDRADEAESGDEDGLAQERAALHGLEDQFHELKSAITDLADDAGDEIAERPLVSVLGAFILGIVVARLLSK